ncbi:Glycoside hydrolase family 13 protein [Mycena kentingensis (nom. inval.)]|nr:Glycoside hydrolase family 13 protein [Mycena kentingensis (nom. inval.)]
MLPVNCSRGIALFVRPCSTSIYSSVPSVIVRYPRTSIKHGLTSTPTMWWKNAVVYQIYPISYADSNGDGLGDIQGIISKLDYLKDLGVDIVWLSPIYKSPLADMGYDISDYRDINPQFGTLADYDKLVEGLHSRGMKLMYDGLGRKPLVRRGTRNHDSRPCSLLNKMTARMVQGEQVVHDQLQARLVHLASRAVRRRRQTPPAQQLEIRIPRRVNLSLSLASVALTRSDSGSAWEYDEPSDEYYLHLFLAKQPDLNWENPAVRAAVWDLMRFWIARGCDGFRMDVINVISKVDGLPDAPVTVPEDEYQDASSFPRVHSYLKEMNREVLSKHDLITVGETPFSLDSAALVQYVLPANKELDMIFQFELLVLDSPKDADRPYTHRPWTLPEFMRIVERWQTLERENGFWNAVYIENHDQARSVTRWGNDSPSWRAPSAKMLAILETTLGGTQYVFQGQEIAMRNFPRTWGLEEYKDVASNNYYNEILTKRRLEQGREDVDMSDILDGMQMKARDHGRIPMQWDASPHAGFTTGTPWMRVNDDYPTWNAAAQLSDPESVLAFWKAALKLRKEYPVLIHGSFELLDRENQHVFAYRRVHDDATAVVLLNFGAEPASFAPKLAPEDRARYRMVLGNYRSSGSEMPPDLPEQIELKGYEGRVYVA